MAGRALPASPPSRTDLIARERERLLLRRDELRLRRAHIDDQLEDIDRELAGLRAYELVKSGKSRRQVTLRQNQANDANQSESDHPSRKRQERAGQAQSAAGTR